MAFGFGLYYWMLDILDVPLIISLGISFALFGFCSWIFFVDLINYAVVRLYLYIFVGPGAGMFGSMTYGFDVTDIPQ